MGQLTFRDDCRSAAAKPVQSFIEKQVSAAWWAYYVVSFGLRLWEKVLTMAEVDIK